MTNQSDVAVLEQEPVVCEDPGHVAHRLDDPGSQGELVGPKAKDQVVELASNGERPVPASEVRALHSRLAAAAASGPLTVMVTTPEVRSNIAVTCS